MTERLGKWASGYPSWLAHRAGDAAYAHLASSVAETLDLITLLAEERSRLRLPIGTELERARAFQLGCRAPLRTLDPIHPGEVLREDVIGGFGGTQNTPAVSIGVPPRRIDEIVHGSRGITA